MNRSTPLTSGLAIFLAAAFLFVGVSAKAAPPSNLAERVEKLRRAYGVPGVAISIVEDGRPTLAKGWGVRQVGTSLAVGPDTVFATGSTGKAFTTAALAILVDRGKIKWDDRVIDHMPDFRMWDPWTTREMTIRDLLVHRSDLGTGAGDLLFTPNSNLSRKETVRRLRHIKPATSFRSEYAYDNLLYIAAGQLIEEVTGRTWEQFVREELLGPLRMSHSTTSDLELRMTADRARPHNRSGGAIVGLGPQRPLDERHTLGSNSAPAGGMSISAVDMTRWLALQLGQGRLSDGRQLISNGQLAEMWRPQILRPVPEQPPGFAAIEPHFDAYALGWRVRDYRGTKILSHGGAVLGSLAVVALIPERNVGFFIAVNSEEQEMIDGFFYELLDHYLSLPARDWPEKFHDLRQLRLADAATLVQAQLARTGAGKPSLPLEDYVGDYTDPWYGTIKVRRGDNGLTIEFPHSVGMNGSLAHHRYDTFRSSPSLHWIEPAYVTFALDSDGKVERVKMKAVSPVADFSYDYHDLFFTPDAREQ